MTTEFGLEQADFQQGKFKKLQLGRDYDFDPALGYISLRSPLNDQEAIGVAFRYLDASGRAQQVGEIPLAGGSEGQQDERRLVLKLLRPANLQPIHPAWFLTMRNIYKIQGQGFNATDFELQIFSERPGEPARKTLNGVNLQNQATLLQALGFDRLNVDGAEAPDDQFDFIQNVTIDPGRGQLYFPYLEPFGSRIRQLIEASSTQVIGTTREAAIETFEFRNLYDQKKTLARQDTQHDIYRIRGSSKSTVNDVYELGFFWRGRRLGESRIRRR